METTLGIISKKYYEEALDKLISFLKINSIYDEKTISEDAPFGKGVKEAGNHKKDLKFKKVSISERELCCQFPFFFL